MVVRLLHTESSGSSTLLTSTNKYNMNKAFILGCSHAAGAEMADGLEQKLELATDRDDYGAANSFPVQIAQLMGYAVENHAVSGGSNDAMFRIAESLLDQITSNDIIVACWTGHDRGEIWYEAEQRWLSIAPGGLNTHRRIPSAVLKQGSNGGDHINDAARYAEVQKQWFLHEFSEPRGRLNKIKNIVALNALAHARGIRVLNIDAFMGVHGYVWPDYIYWASDVEFCNWCLDRNYPKTEWGHFFRPAHETFANYVVNRIRTDQ